MPITSTITSTSTSTSELVAERHGPPVTDPVTLQKEAALIRSLRERDSVVVAYSGGVDSTYLADAAHEALGGKAYLFLADSPSIPRSEVAAAQELARERGWNLHIVPTDEFGDDRFLANDGRRCYYCKTALFRHMAAFAREHGIQWLAYGENADDGNDPTRHGARAAAESGAIAPLRDAGLGKDEIRLLSRARELPTAEKASFACLASRFPVGARIEHSQMSRIEQAEEILKAAGFHQYRARHHGEFCRIELGPEDFALALREDVRQRLHRDIAALGYRYVTLDLAGYRDPTSRPKATEPLLHAHVE